MGLKARLRAIAGHSVIANDFGSQHFQAMSEIGNKFGQSPDKAPTKSLEALAGQIVGQVVGQVIGQASHISLKPEKASKIVYKTFSSPRGYDDPSLPLKARLRAFRSHLRR